MLNFSYFRSGLIIIIILILVKYCNAQIFIDHLVSPTEMVNSLVGSGIYLSGINYIGSDSATAIFNSNGYTDIELKEGICLSSGRIKYAGGPNSIDENLSFVNGTYGDFLLSGLLQQLITWDASILEFDIEPSKNWITLSFIFGSEEYPEWADFNEDVIGIFISGPNPIGSNYFNKNIATIPGTNLPICVLNINNVTPSFPEYYIDNSTGQYFAYDGLTTVFSPFTNVYPDSNYHIRIGIADADDQYYDSGLFLEQNSLKSLDSNDFARFRFKEVYNQNIVMDIIGSIENDMINLFIPYFANLTQMVSSFTIPPGTTAYVDNQLQISDTTINDFSGPVTYTLVSNTGTSKDWTIVVDYLPNIEHEIIEYSFLVENNSNLWGDLLGVVDGQSVFIEAPDGTDMSNLVATFTLSDNATAFVEGIVQQSGLTTNNFADTVLYIVEAENGDTSHYEVIVNFVTDINENKNPETTILPYTGNNKITIESLYDITVSIYSVSGSLVYQIKANKGINSVDIKNIPSGLYLINVRSNKSYITKKVFIHN